MDKIDFKMTSESNIMKAFNYMVVGLASKFLELKYVNYNTLTPSERLHIFNKENNFDKFKLAQIVSILCLANGHKKELIRFFNYQFIPLNIGIVQMNVYKNLIESKFDDLQFVINDDKVHFKEYSELCFDENYLQKNMSFYNNNLLQEFNFIDKSILHIHARYPKFAMFDSTELNLVNRLHIIDFTYESFRKQYEDCKFNPNVRLHVDFIKHLLSEITEIEPVKELGEIYQ